MPSRSDRMKASLVREGEEVMRQGRSGSVAVPALGQPFVDFLALRADREPLGVPARRPDLAAQGDHRIAGHRALDNLVLVDVVGEPLVVPVAAVREIRPDVSLDPGATFGLSGSVRKNLGAHTFEFKARAGASGSVLARVVGEGGGERHFTALPAQDLGPQSLRV